jgi:multisubunit Na+/H+ antiporter MnhB subunit
VRVHDWLDFAVAALIGAVAFLLAVPYLDTFGTWQHYLTAFLAGASGSLVVNWTLLPWARSYVGGASGKKAAPDAPKVG